MFSVVLINFFLAEIFMTREQVLARVEILISEITSEFERGLAMGYIGVFLSINFISPSEYRQFSDRILAE
jgi:hypothetical protein